MEAGMDHDDANAHQSVNHPPGTVSLENLQLFSDKVILHPIPSKDPNDPLNWSTWRKTINFSLAMLYCLMTFVELDIGFTAWDHYQNELGMTPGVLNSGTALGFAGLGIGSFLFIPLMHKYGRRPLYIFSTIVQLLASLWLARTQTKIDNLLGNLLTGIGGATCETIVQVTISDIFFVHQHAAMNAFYMLFTQVGTFLGPVAAGYVVDSMGWRWIWYFCVIFFGVILILVVFCYEESKYVMAPLDQYQTAQLGQDPTAKVSTEHVDDLEQKMDIAEGEQEAIDRTQTRSYIDHNIPAKSYWQRMALITPTPGSILPSMIEPFPTLFTIPAVTYTALTYGTLLAVFAILTTVQALYMFDAPYNFTAAGVGLMNVAPFVGTIPGTIIGGWLNDKSIIWLSKRNNGIYEPEMRLWMALPFAIICPAGILMLGVGLAYGASWPILAVGYGLFGFSLTVVGTIALSYTMDSYHGIVGSAMVGIIFTRNIFSVAVLFALNPWIEGMGLRNVHILLSAVVCVIMLIPLPLLKWGKRARSATAKRYTDMALKQPTHRTL